MIYLAVCVILITEAAKVREHLWAGVTHEHWAKRPSGGKRRVVMAESGLISSSNSCSISLIDGGNNGHGTNRRYPRRAG